MKDPAFLYYDGDAARDVSHMNRLERGCYFDLIQAQRKFGRMTESIIKKVLGKDFDTCWESVKICLTYDNDMYFIEWLENSTIKRKEYSESRRKNRINKKLHDMNNISESYDEHMENENVIVNDNITVNNKYSADFLTFWEAYPKKVGKDGAYRSWQKKKDKPDISNILAKLKLQKESEQWIKESGQYIPLPATYINQGRWHDEIKAKKLVVVL